jgi:CHAT domain-containing protein
VRRVFLVFVLLATLSCTVPPPDKHIDTTHANEGLDIGTTTTGEHCRQQTGKSEIATIYCNDWELPAGDVHLGRPGGPPDLDRLATSGAWRLGIDMRFVCEAPEPLPLANAQSALLLRCKRRIGGWPQVALVARVDGKIYFGDGISPLLPVLERSIGVLSGHLEPAAAAETQPSLAMRRLIERLSAQAFIVGDVTEYDRLMALGARANLSEDFIAAASAFRAAAKLQQTTLGRNNPNTSVALMSLALQLSNRGQFTEADTIFNEAARLAPDAADQAAPARLMHYRALHRLNQDKPDEALPLLDDAERAYTRLAPREAVEASARTTTIGDAARFPSQRVLTDPVAQSALMGLVEVRRYRSVAYRNSGRIDQARDELGKAERLAAANALVQPIIGARVARTAAQIEEARNDDAASSLRLDRAVSDFRLSLPLTRPFAATALLRAATDLRHADVAGTITRCNAAVQVLRDLKLGIDSELLEPCLSAFALRAEQSSAERQTLLGTMFEVAQLGQDILTSQLIAQSSARLAEAANNLDIAKAIRRRQDAEANLGALYSVRDAMREARLAVGRPYDGPHFDAPALDARIASALVELKDSDGAVQVAAPKYGQLLQQVVSAAEVFKRLRPGEAMAQVTVGLKETWTLLLRDRQISLGHSETDIHEMKGLVSELRSVLQPQNGLLPAFSAAPAHSIYAATLGTVASSLQGTTDLVVVPSGSLMSLPFGLLLTGDFDGADLHSAPWLVRSMSIAHAPSAANFTELRDTARESHAAQPWIGFGDFQPVSRTVALRTFQGPGCAEVAGTFASLSPLPHSRSELEIARAIMGGRGTDLLLGKAFTADAVRRAPLKSYRIIHFATHAMLPSDPECLPQQLIITSAPGGSTTADGAMLNANDILKFDLDAETVILSACNSGRPNKLAGESLSALARAFFYAGSRSLLATHWSLDDAAAAQVVSDLLRDHRRNAADGLARSLQAAQLAWLDSTGSAHPYYWAPIALIGESGAGQAPGRTAANTLR